MMHEHTHEHSHEHSHAHAHDGGASHCHSHAHPHEHPHPHPHSHGEISAFDSCDQAAALMSYMLDHNRHHADELHELCHKLEASGKNQAALLIEEAVDRFNEGNVLLAAALEKLGQE